MHNSENTHHVFTDEELRACAEGQCCQCGVCCAVFKIRRIPLILGDVESSGMRKHAGDVCWQLQQDSRGRFVCALHAEKEHPNMRVCREWSGAIEHQYEMRSWYDIKNREAIHLMVAPSTAEQICTVQKLIQRGAIPSDAAQWIDHYLKGNVQKLIICLRLYLSHFKVVPEDIFSYLRIRDHIAALDDGEKYELFLACFSGQNDPLREKFCELYAPELQKYYSAEATA